MFQRKIICSLFLGAALIGCRPANLKDYDKPYFDFDSLVNIQIKKFSQGTHSVEKTSALDGKHDVSSFKIDSTHLAHEWDVFRQLDWINKPIYKGNYAVTEKADAKSNLMIRSYVAKVKSPIPFVHFYFKDNFKNLKKIESQYEETNALYYTNRKLSMTFDENLIHQYSIEGSQKLILSDSVKFSIIGRIFF